MILSPPAVSSARPEKIPNALLALELIEGLRAYAGASEIAATFA